MLFLPYLSSFHPVKSAQMFILFCSDIWFLKPVSADTDVILYPQLAVIWL